MESLHSDTFSGFLIPVCLLSFPAPRQRRCEFFGNEFRLQLRRRGRLLPETDDDQTDRRQVERVSVGQCCCFFTAAGSARQRRVFYFIALAQQIRARKLVIYFYLCCRLPYNLINSGSVMSTTKVNSTGARECGVCVNTYTHMHRHTNTHTYIL